MLAEGQSARQIDSLVRHELSAITFDVGELDTVLAQVVATARKALPASVWGISLFARDPGNSFQAAYSDPDRVGELEAMQRAAGAGVSLEALTRNRPVSYAMEDLAWRWPDLAAGAEPHGVKAVVAIPLGVASQTVGTLTLYVTRSEAFDERSAEVIGRGLASHAAPAVFNAMLLAASQARVAQLTEALETREIIAQAKGIIMARMNCDADAAFDVLRDVSQRSHRKLRDVAVEVVDRLDAQANPDGAGHGS